MHKVLIAEDDIDQLNLITKILGNYKDQFEVVPVKNGKEAIEILKYEPVSLVVTDIQMPGLNGMILLAYVHTYHPSIPCIVMTAYGTSRLKSRLPDDLLRFFQKPLNVHDLAHAILAVLKRAGAEKSEKGISLVNFLNLIEMEKSTCIFEIYFPDMPTGRMVFYDGVLFDAEYGNLKGEPAALKILSLEEVNYRFKPPPQQEVPRVIKTELGDLIRNVIGDFEKAAKK